LPDASRFQNCRNTLRDWRYDSRYQDRFVEYAETVEADYPSLVDWTRTHADQLLDPPLPSVAREVWQKTAAEIANWSSLDEAVIYLEGNSESIERTATTGFWSVRGETPGWWALALAGSVMRDVQQALSSLEDLKSPADVIHAYVGRWWQIDRSYRQCKGALEIPFLGSNVLVGWLDRSYSRFLTETNQRWTSLLSDQEVWVFPGILPRQATFWDRMVSSSASRRAVFLVDALRYELGQTLVERLRAEYDASLEPLITDLPSNTPLGMSALMPKAEQRQVDWDEDWLITVPGFKGNLAKKLDRDKLLQTQLKKVDILTLKDLLKTEMAIGEDVPWLIVTASHIDAIGESTGTLTPKMLEELVKQVVQGIRRVAQIGFDEVHVVSDHGFLLLDRVDDHGKAKLPGSAWLKKSPRYAVGCDPLASEHLHFSIPYSAHLAGCFPHGVVCFQAWGQYNYVHGGPALQEVIVPHLTVQISPLSRPVGVEIEADAETRVAFFKVTLKPIPQRLVSQEREVRLALERADGTTIRDSTEIIAVQEPVVKNLKVYPQDNVAFGDTLHITVYDARTNEHLARHAIRFLVSLEL
jgi:hypothetical protein